jgi:uncharacterized protein (DUF427 family)
VDWESRSELSERPANIQKPGPGQESVWDYPRPPRIEPVSKRIHVELGGVVLADTTKALRVLETASPPVYYVPLKDVRTEYLAPSRTRTVCEWKGTASYWSVRMGDQFVADVAWSYEHPLRGFESIRGYLAFYAGKVDACFVDDQRVTPQKGGFYGGWITPNIVGPFKGEPGTMGW